MQKRTLAPKLVAGALILSLSMTALPFIPSVQTVSAATVPYTSEDAFDFDAESGCITAYKGAEQIVNVPETIGGVTVKGIEWGAFSESAVAQVTLPDTITTIGSMAFEKCTQLTSINIPDNIEVLAPYTFYGCTSLTEITLPSATTEIMLEAFSGCINFKKITIPSSVTTIDAEAFNNCSSLTIVAEKGSYAETFANSAGITFEEVVVPDDDNDSNTSTNPDDDGDDSDDNTNNTPDDSDNNNSTNTPDDSDNNNTNTPDKDNNNNNNNNNTNTPNKDNSNNPTTNVGNADNTNETEDEENTDAPITEVVEGSSTLTQVSELITSNPTDDDVKGTSYAKLSLRVSKSTNKTQKLKWNKVKGADGYVIFANKCGKPLKEVKTITNGKTTSYTNKKLSKGTYYKYVVLAYELVDEEQITLTTSKTIYTPTTGGKFCDIKSVKANKTKVTLKEGKSTTLKASEVKENKKKKISRHRKITFESTNPKVATVSNKGKIKAKAKGTCYVYAYAQNGVYKKVKVTVK